MQDIRWILIIGVLILFTSAVIAQEPETFPEASGNVQNQLPASNQPETGSQDTVPMTDIHDIKPLLPVPVPVSLIFIALWAGLCILSALLLLGSWLLWKRRRVPQAKPIEAMLSPEDMARRRLASLSADTQEGKLFYFQLSGALREYIHGRFGIDSLEMTTEELLPRLEVLALEKDLKREVKSFLVACDPVKFADAPTHRSTMTRDLEFVLDFVEKTTASSTENTEEMAAQDPGE
jgi:hypothetical protein